ncbi:MAG: WbqC family protein [Candidatus Obscuribacter phosphatis]|uniref:WbqC family protein n=1 Tax=Candidatus Obscuribacter phosphatis TaxID=1906157 RepID=A0A8J7P8S2_9BACT|nr:WbqC family protein [Candidatus Obscuribacter phosphatis]
MKKVAILQSNYIPWKGYFDLIADVDDFVIYDEVQYTRRDWRNRNKIKTKNGTKWLTVPVQSKGLFSEKISEMKVAEPNWSQEHFKTIRHEYAKATCFDEYAAFVERLYTEAAGLDFLSQINALFIERICSKLEIETRIRQSCQFTLQTGKSERLLGICKDLHADVYVSGPAAKSYLDEDLFARQNIKVEWYSYGQYPEYSQLHPPFEHAVSILDLLFNTGKNARSYMHRHN